MITYYNTLYVIVRTYDLICADISTIAQDNLQTRERYKVHMHIKIFLLCVCVCLCEYAVKWLPC